jgi:hypothetical protein
MYVFVEEYDIKKVNCETVSKYILSHGLRRHFENNSISSNFS